MMKKYFYMQRARMFVLAVLMVCISFISSHAQSTQFPDLIDDWSTDAVYWAVGKSIVGGYPDGMFRPRNDVLEAEWASMMFKYFEPGVKLVPPSGGQHWAQSIYDALDKYKLPFVGKESDQAKNTPLKRVEIAKITASLYGFNLNEPQAVEFMYDNDFSSGMGGGRYYESYGVNHNLQRQQAVMFIMKVHNQVSNNGGVTYREIFYPLQDGRPVGIPNGGKTFPDTTVASIEWARFNEHIKSSLASFIQPVFISRKPSYDHPGTFLLVQNAKEYIKSGESYKITVECTSHPEMAKYCPADFSTEKGFTEFDQHDSIHTINYTNFDDMYMLFQLRPVTGRCGYPLPDDIPSQGETVKFKVTITKGTEVQTYYPTLKMGEAGPVEY